MNLRMHKLAFFTLFIVNTSFGQVHTSWPKKDTKELSISVKEGPVSDDPFYDVVVAGKTKEGNYWCVTTSKEARDQNFVYHQYKQDLELTAEKPFFSNSKKSDAALWDVVKIGEHYYALFSTKVDDDFSVIFAKSIDISTGEISKEKKILCKLPWKGKKGFPIAELKFLEVKDGQNEIFGISGCQNQSHLYKKGPNNNVLLNYQFVWVFDSALDLKNSASIYSGRGKVIKPVHSEVFIDKYHSIFRIDKSELMNFRFPRGETYKGATFSIKQFSPDGHTNKYESERDIHLSDINIFSKSRDVFGIVEIYTRSIWNKQYKSRLKQTLLDKKTMEIVEEIDYPLTEKFIARVSSFDAESKKKYNYRTKEEKKLDELKSNNLIEGLKI
jgi:hypothetical protein